MTFDGFSALAGVVRDIADPHCEGRLAMVLEGGYHLKRLAGGVHSVLEVLAGGEPREPQECGVAEVMAAADFHRSAFTRE